MTVVPETSVNPLAEALLDELGLEWQLVMLPREQIDHEKSLRNQARIDPIHKDLVERYTEARKNGAVFPAILVGFNGGSTGRTADGNHRVESGDVVGVELHPAYRFSYASEQEFRAVADLANARLNGAESTLEERLMHAADHVARGVPNHKAAALFGVGKSQLAIFVSAQRVRERLRALGIGARAHADVTDATLVKIASVATDETIGPALKAIRTGHPALGVIKTLRDAGQNELTVEGKTQAQMESLALLHRSAMEAKASDLTGAEKRKRDTTRMRLIGCIKAIEDATADPRPDYAPIFARIREVLPRG